MALNVLYESELKERPPSDALAEPRWWGSVTVEGTEEGLDPDPEVIDYARLLIEGVMNHRQEIDQLMTRYADRWAIDRIPVVDRILLRVAVFEIVWNPEVPVAVAINEAVELAKSYSTEDSGRFINGLLGKIASMSRETQ